MDRRHFLLSTAASVGGTLLLPGMGLAATATTTYQRTTLRSTGGGLVRIADGESREGDFAVFAMLRNGRVEGPVDLFAVVPAPTGDDRDCALTPLGRKPDLATARAILRATRSNRALLFPTWGAWLLHWADRWLPWFSEAGNVRYRDQVLSRGQD